MTSIARSYEVQFESKGSVDWDAALSEGQQVLVTAVKDGRWNCVTELLESFGTEGNVYDFLVAFSAPNLMLPGYWRFERWAFPESLDLGITEDEYHDARLQTAQIVAGVFDNWSDTQQLRFYRALVWSRFLRVSSIPGLMKVVEETTAGFAEAQGREEWFYVRAALLIMYCTQELPAFDELSPEAVRDAFADWSQRPWRYSMVPSECGVLWQRVPKFVVEWSGGDLRDLRDKITTPFSDWQFGRVSPIVVLDHSEKSIF